MLGIRYSIPQVDYGQKKGAFNPDSRAPVYQQVERARKEGDFASLFAADIMFGKKESGEFVYTYAPGKAGSGGEPASGTELGKHKVNGQGYLYNKNSLNASQSWVPQAFAAPAVRGDDGAWYSAQLLYDPKAGKGKSPFGFIPGQKITDENAVRLLEGGHYAFKAEGAGGTEVYVGWAGGFEPKKNERGAPEAANRKKEENTLPASARKMVSVGAAEPGNVMGGKVIDGSQARSLLGPVGQQNRTLLGGA